MRALLWPTAAYIPLLVSMVRAQQLQGKPAYLPYTGLQPACLDALNASVACPRVLDYLAESGAIADDDITSALCVDSCLDALNDARSTIEGACGKSDSVVIDNVAYPATFFADNYLLAYDLSCRKDRTTGRRCDPQLLLWSEGGDWNATRSCSDCWLGAQALQLNNPLGYDAELATNFALLTASCNVSTGYAVTSPTAYALNSTATTVPASVTASPPSTCTGSYTVQENDDCNSVAAQFNVSTYNLLISNGLDIYCQNFAAAVDSALCIPESCDLYTWHVSDTCAKVALQHPGVTIPQFLAWNANFNDLCQNGGNFDGYQVCVSPPGGYLKGASPSNAITTGSSTTVQAAPTNAANGTKRECGRWYTVRARDTCGQVSIANTISLSDFYFLNPEIDANCTNLLLDVAYCVKASGDIATYSGYTTSGGASITVPLASFPSVNTAVTTATQTSYSYSKSLMPTASGTVADCSYYTNYNASVKGIDDCSFLASAWQIATSQLLQWNPSLGSDLASCSLQDGKSYCVGKKIAACTNRPQHNSRGRANC